MIIFKITDSNGHDEYIRQDHIMNVYTDEVSEGNATKKVTRITLNHRECNGAYITTDTPAAHVAALWAEEFNYHGIWTIGSDGMAQVVPKF